MQVITYLGLEIDSTELQVRVPKEKLRVLLSMLDDFASKSKLTLRQLQSLTGSLNFVCKAVGPGRAFLRRLIDLTRGVHKAHHRIRISKGAKADLLAWWEFLLHFNGTVCLGDSVWRRNDFFQFTRMQREASALAYILSHGGPRHVCPRRYLMPIIQLGF